MKAQRVKQAAIKSVPGYIRGLGTPNGLPTGIAWDKADYHSDAGRKALADAISGYFRDVAPKHAYGEHAHKHALQYLSGLKTTRPGHIPGSLPTRPDIDVDFYGPELDYGWQVFFQYVDKRSSKNPTYQRAHVSAQAIVFEQAQEGQPARLRKVEGGTPLSLSSVKWHGAIGIDDDAKRFDDYGIFEQNVQRVPDMWDNYLSTIHYALITALGSGVNETWDTSLIKTLNNAGAQILEDCGEVYGLPDSPSFALLYNHRDWEAVTRALVSNFTLPNDNNSANKLQWNILPVKTRKIAPGSMYLGLPGYDAVTVEWDGLYAEYGRDWERGADAFVYRSRRNAGILNVQQFRRITPEEDSG